MTIGNELGEREIVFMGKSEFSGAFVVEDVICEQKLFRRLIFLDTPNVIQSEVLLLKRTRLTHKLQSLPYGMFHVFFIGILFYILYLYFI